MKNLIRIVVGSLVLCGALAAVPGVAEAREPERAGVARVEARHDRGHEGDRDRGRFDRGHDRNRFGRDRVWHRDWR
jgi:hypothetical protein